MRSGSKWPMTGPRPCAYACAYVDPVFTSHKHQHKKNELVRFSCVCAYTYDYPPVKTGL